MLDEICERVMVEVENWNIKGGFFCFFFLNYNPHPSQRCPPETYSGIRDTHTVDTLQ